HLLGRGRLQKARCVKFFFPGRRKRGVPPISPDTLPRLSSKVRQAAAERSARLVRRRSTTSPIWAMWVGIEGEQDAGGRMHRSPAPGSQIFLAAAEGMLTLAFHRAASRHPAAPNTSALEILAARLAIQF